MRIDKFLFEKGYAQSRSKATAIVESGAVEYGGKVISKPSFEIEVDENGNSLCEIKIIKNSLPYVSRAGLKLKAAIDSFGISVSDKISLDIGASTGGFTDCLLKEGAQKVYSLDCGHGQLHESLCVDSRVVSMEGINARDISYSMFNTKFDIAVMDVSFISQSLIYDPLTSVLNDGAILISLIKPQFEAGREHLSKNGVVCDKKVHLNVIKKLAAASAVKELYMTDVIPSPIRGGEGNIEYLALFTYKKINTISFDNIKKFILK